MVKIKMENKSPNNPETFSVSCETINIGCNLNSGILGFYEMWGSSGGEDVHGGVLCCDALWTSDLKTEAVCSCEMLVRTYKSTRRHNPEDHHRHRG
jgi:hypothetical protein